MVLIYTIERFKLDKKMVLINVGLLLEQNCVQMTNMLLLKCINCC